MPVELPAVLAGLNILATIGGGFYFMGVVKTRLDRVEKDVSETKGLVTTAAVEADRLRRAEADIDNLEDDVRNMRRGVGFINDKRPHGIVGEYGRADSG